MSSIANLAALPVYDSQQVRADLIARREIALLDVREEDPHAQAHPLFAANLPYARIELDAWTKLPKRDVHIVVFDDGEQLAEPAARRLIALGYTRVSLLRDGLQGWRDMGGELFRDVNVPSKAFGELVEAQAHTPSLSAEQVQAMIDTRADAVIVDARRFDEYRTMSIPGGVSVPGAELALRIQEIAPHPTTRVIVNCAGRTRSIIGAQSLINAGIPNPVVALRNGTIGWTLAGQTLEHGQQQRFPDAGPHARRHVAANARALADRAGVLRADVRTLAGWHTQAERTLYLFDVRTPEEYLAGHLPDFLSAPGGQLVQETDMFAPVRGARIVLVDDDGVRANMTASWLAQMAWEVFVLDGVQRTHFSERGKPPVPRPAPTPLPVVSPLTLSDWLAGGNAPVVLDFASHRHYVQQHIPGAWFALRSQLASALQKVPVARRYVLTSEDGVLAAFAASDLRAHLKAEVFVLDGGTQRWQQANLPVESGPSRLASPPIDRYRRPYEGTDAPHDAMQAYLDWEFGLVEQLARDGTHHFRVLTAPTGTDRSPHAHPQVAANP